MNYYTYRNKTWGLSKRNIRLSKEIREANRQDKIPRAKKKRGKSKRKKIYGTCPVCHSKLREIKNQKGSYLICSRSGKRHYKYKTDNQIVKIAVKDKKHTNKYKIYINSIHWENRKNSYWQNHKRECAKCQSIKIVQLHHCFYRNGHYGKEPDEDLIPLCQNHHKEFHEKYGVKKNMKRETQEFIITK